MPVTRLYLDHAASTPLVPEARAAWLQGMEIWANPSSPHKEGRAARAALEDARARLKVALGWQGELVFTSGASEALAIAIAQSKLPLAAVSSIEHDAVLRHAHAVARLPVDGAGRVDSDAAALGGLVAVQAVNSEIGTIQKTEAIADAVRGAGGVFLCDFAQGAGKRPLPDADLIVLAAHKFGGPIGIGALLVRDWGLLQPTGGQERGYRGGTENLPAVLAMAAALEAGDQWLKTAARLRARLDSGIEAAGGEIVAREAARIETIASYRMPGKAAAVQLIRFDAMGIAVSAGSACSSGSLKTSHVLAAIGFAHPDEVIRVSIGRETTEADIDAFLAAWRAVAGQAHAA